MTLREKISDLIDSDKYYAHELVWQILQAIKEEMPKKRHTNPEQCSSNDVYANSCKADYIYNQALADVRKKLGIEKKGG